jgi:DNA ligase-1
MKTFKPMLAYSGDLEIFEKLLDRDGFLYVSPKIDGIRAAITEDGVLSRSLKPIRNRMVQQKFNFKELIGYDGELITGNLTDPNVFNKTTSNVMSFDGEEYTTFYIFDNFKLPDYKFLDRMYFINNDDNLKIKTNVSILPNKIIHSIDELNALEVYYTELGYEGVMVRSPQSHYKYGRSTAKEGGLGKLKRFVDSEAVILSMECKYHNDNPSFTNELGRTARSSAQADLVPMDTMGVLHVRDIHNGLEFGLGTGFNDDDRKWFWENRDKVSGLIIKYRYFSVGMKDLPRHPSYKGIRDNDDLS